MFVVKDFIVTAEGLVFAVVENGVEQGKVLCFLRYQWHHIGWQKLSTTQANQLLQVQYPQYLYYSELRDAQLHALAINSISRHLQPREALQQLIISDHNDPVQQDCCKLIQLFIQQGLNSKQIGITGSLLLGAQNPQSDIDLVFYKKSEFQQARNIIKILIENKSIKPLSPSDWQASYARRLGALDLDEYIRHEKRKFNKAIINDRKFDISLVSTSASVVEKFEKKGRIKLQALVTDATSAFDYPAKYTIAAHEISSVVSYTATYSGQAVAGERVEIAGYLEKSSAGVQRIVVGSSREAVGEYIKVIESTT